MISNGFYIANMLQILCYKLNYIECRTEFRLLSPVKNWLLLGKADGEGVNNKYDKHWSCQESLIALKRGI